MSQQQRIISFFFLVIPPEKLNIVLINQIMSWKRHGLFDFDLRGLLSKTHSQNIKPWNITHWHQCMVCKHDWSYFFFFLVHWVNSIFIFLLSVVGCGKLHAEPQSIIIIIANSLLTECSTFQLSQVGTQRGLSSNSFVVRKMYLYRAGQKHIIVVCVIIIDTFFVRQWLWIHSSCWLWYTPSLNKQGSTKHSPMYVHCTLRR